MQENAQRVKLELLCRGVRLPLDLLSRFPGYRHKRASLSEGLCFDLSFPGLPGAVPVNLAARERFVARSPFSFDPGSGMILKDGEPFVRAVLVEPPAWYAETLPDGTAFQEIFQVHHRTILATALANFCAFRARGGGCAFCALGPGGSPARVKDPARLAEVLRELKARGLSFSEVNVNSGTLETGERTLAAYEAAVSAVRSVVDWPVYVQLCPPDDPDAERRLADAGVDSLSYNLEIWDEERRRELIPEKAALGRERYLSALARASRVLGRGQASSWLIAGLEPVESTLEGIRAVAAAGAVPFVTVFRPLLGSRMENALPPEPDVVEPVFEYLARILASERLFPARTRAGCVKCGCCTAWAGEPA